MDNKDTNRNGKTSNEDATTSAEVKPPYQAPVVMPLGELSKGWGQGQCYSGPGAQGLCGKGPGAHGIGQCQPGSTAQNCGVGSGII